MWETAFRHFRKHDSVISVNATLDDTRVLFSGKVSVVLDDYAVISVSTRHGKITMSLEYDTITAIDVAGLPWVNVTTEQMIE